MRRYFSPYCCCMMTMLRERIFDKKQYQPNFLGRNQRWLFAGRDTEAPESWDWGLGDIERCWLMESGVYYICLLHFDCLVNLKIIHRLYWAWIKSPEEIKWDSFSVQSTDVGWIAGPGREWQQYSITGHPWWTVTERNASRKWKCCKTVSKGDDAVKSEVEQGYALDQAMISIFSIFRSKAGVKLTFYWWLILLRCCLSVAATLQTTVMLPVCC